MRPLTATIDGQTLTLPAEPAAALTGGAALLGLLIVLLAVRVALKARDQSPVALILRVSWLGSGGLVALLLAPVAETGDLLWAMPPLRTALLASGVVGWLGLSLAAVELYVRSQERDKEVPWSWRSWAELPVVALTGVLLLAGSLQMRQSWQGVHVPSISARGCAQIHQGVHCLPTLELRVLGKPDVNVQTGLFFKRSSVRRHWFMGEMETSSGTHFEDAQGWKLPEQAVPSAQIGSVSYQAYAVRGEMMVRTELGPFSVVEDRPDPRLAVAPGSTWRFSSRVSRSQRVILLRHESSSWDGETLLAQVGERELVDGLYRYPLRVQRGDGPLGEMGYLQNANGQSVWRYGGKERAWLSTEVSAMGEQPARPYDTFSELPQGGYECVQPYTEGVCVCAPPGSVPGQALAGPIQCRTHQSAGVGETLLLGFLAIATLGLTPGVSQGQTDWVLESSAIEPILSIEPVP